MKARVAVAALLLLAACKTRNPAFEDSGAGSGGADGTASDSGTGTSTNGSTTNSSLPTADGTGPMTGGSMSMTDTFPTKGSGSGSDTGDPASLERCCEKHAGGGCMQGAVSECVCDAMPGCCADAWSEQCVEFGRSNCDLFCEHRCCQSAGMDNGGCAEAPLLEACVCQLDPLCCNLTWDQTCVFQARTECALQCGGGPCDVAHEGRGCHAPEIEMCACNVDPSCCAVSWDDVCVEIAQDCATKGP